MTTPPETRASARPPGDQRAGASAIHNPRDLPPATAGFSLVELVVAVVVLAVGVLGFAGTTTYLNRQATIADMRAERARATANVLERLRTLPFDSIAPGSESNGPYQFEWLVEPYFSAKSVTLIVRGPGHAPARAGRMPMIIADLTDTVRYRVPRP